MSLEQVRDAVGGNPSTDTAAMIGAAAKRLDDIATEMGKARTEDTARFDALREEQATQAAILSDLKGKAETEERESALTDAVAAAAEWRQFAAGHRNPSKASRIGSGGGSGHGSQVAGDFGPRDGDFIFAVMQARSRDSDEQREGKAALAEMARQLEGKAAIFEKAAGKATLGTTDALGGFIIPNAIVDEFIKPARHQNIYRTLTTSVTGVNGDVEVPFRSGLPTRATIAPWGDVKENLNLAYNGYTVTQYTLARIHDVSNQFLRRSRGAAEADVISELATALALGESYYIREGTGSSQPFGYTPALTNGPAAFRTTFTPSSTTLAGSIATSIALAAGALAGRGHLSNNLSAVVSATSYWTMLSQGTDSAGFFFAPAAGPTAINAPAGTLITPFGIPVYPDSGADNEGTAAVIDNLVVGNWKTFKVYYGESYRLDQSDEAGERWDRNLTGFRAEEEMGFDARPAVYTGNFQMITDITP